MPELSPQEKYDNGDEVTYTIVPKCERTNYIWITTWRMQHSVADWVEETQQEKEGIYIYQKNEVGADQVPE